MKIRKVVISFCILFIIPFLLSTSILRIVSATDYDVADETQLVSAISLADFTNGDVIYLLNDIQLTSMLQITAGMNITLKSKPSAGDTTYKLIGANGHATVGVTNTGILNIDGISITHNSGASGHGVFVGFGTYVGATEENGTVNLLSGSINGNTDYRGGGVHVLNGTFNMYGGSIYDNKAIDPAVEFGFGGGVDVNDYAVFNMYAGEIRNNTASSNGGGVSAFGYFYMEDGEIHNNSSDTYGGGVYCEHGNAPFDMVGGIISNNYSGYAGGGVAINGNRVMNMTGGEITDNDSFVLGGGIYVFMNSTINIENALISRNNSMYGNAGGIAVYNGCSATISNSVISYNVAAYDGGGIYLIGELVVNAGVSFLNNQATNTNGGAIRTESATYANIKTHPGTIFSGNTASLGYEPPANYNSYVDIGFASTSITYHPINNYDINYIGNTDAQIILTYMPNGGTGVTLSESTSYKSANFTVKDVDDLGFTRAGYIFVGWNTKSDNSGVEYLPGEAITGLTSNMILYAQWQPITTGNPNTTDISVLAVTIVLITSLLSSCWLIVKSAEET